MFVLQIQWWTEIIGPSPLYDVKLIRSCVGGASADPAT